MRSRPPALPVFEFPLLVRPELEPLDELVDDDPPASPELDDPVRGAAVPVVGADGGGVRAGVCGSGKGEGARGSGADELAFGWAPPPLPDETGEAVRAPASPVVADPGGAVRA